MIEINNLTKFGVDKKFFTGVAKKVMKGENKETESLSVAFVNPDEIKKLNSDYRKKNKPTDVLSFGVPEGYAQGKEKELGEVIICPDVVSANAKKFGSSLDTEMAKVLIHGILHLCGYDHEGSAEDARKMEEKESKYLTAIN